MKVSRQLYQALQETMQKVLPILYLHLDWRLILIYLVLAAQFESFIDPFAIMLTVPLALAGALLSLWVFGQTLNIFSEIGMIMLIGLVTKNGILIVEFANQKREHGLEKMEAVVEAAAQRLRPILMTSLATSLGCIADCAEPGCCLYQPDSAGYRGGWRYPIFTDPDFVCNSCSIYFYYQANIKYTRRK